MFKRMKYINFFFPEKGANDNIWSKNKEDVGHW